MRARRDGSRGSCEEWAPPSRTATEQQLKQQFKHHMRNTLHNNFVGGQSTITFLFAALDDGADSES